MVRSWIFQGLLALCSSVLAYNANDDGTFVLYPTVEPDQLAGGLGINVQCLDALNTTIRCNPDIFQWTVTLDNFYWDTDNLTDLCNGNCTTDVVNWQMSVESACANQFITIDGMKVPAETIADRYADGYNIACLQSVNETYCMLESQEWIGSDIVQPDCDPTSGNGCDEDDNETTAAYVRIANLYDNSTLCSDCFLRMFYNRLTSPFLPDTDHSDYLIAQYQDMQDVCNTTIADLVIRVPPTYSPAPTATATTTATAANATCTGQTIPASASSKGCNALSTQYGATTGDLQFFSNSDNCTFSSPICVPSACKLYQVATNDSCDSIAASLTTSSYNVTTYLFQTWNRNINGFCDSPDVGQYVCAGPPGGYKTLPTPPVASNGGDNGQQRGGPTGTIVNPTQSTAANATSSAPMTAKPTATQSGIASNCNSYAQATSGDYCYQFASEHGIATSLLYQLNPVLGNNGQNCSNEFWASEYYCVGTSTSSSAPTTSPPVTSGKTSSSSSISRPTATQSGIASNCVSYVMATPSDYCTQFAQENNIAAQVLYNLNPILGPQGQNCSTEFWANEYYCVAASS